MLHSKLLMAVDLPLDTATMAPNTRMLIHRCRYCLILTICRLLFQTASIKASQVLLELEEHMEVILQMVEKAIIAKRITLPWELLK
jgi:hypothetical protein